MAVDTSGSRTVVRSSRKLQSTVGSLSYSLLLGQTVHPDDPVAIVNCSTKQALCCPTYNMRETDFGAESAMLVHSSHSCCRVNSLQHYSAVTTFPSMSVWTALQGEIYGFYGRKLSPENMWNVLNKISNDETDETVHAMPDAFSQHSPDHQ